MHNPQNAYYLINSKNVKKMTLFFQHLIHHGPILTRLISITRYTRIIALKSKNLIKLTICINSVRHNFHLSMMRLKIVESKYPSLIHCRYCALWLQIPDMFRRCREKQRKAVTRVSTEPLGKGG